MAQNKKDEENKIVLVGEKISKIPSSKLPTLSQKLTYLNLAHNCITVLPEMLFAQCVSLQKLNLTGNKLCVIPNGIGNLNKLHSRLPATSVLCWC